MSSTCCLSKLDDSEQTFFEMTQSTLDALEAKFATTGQVWKWVDHNANAFQVFFRELRPERIQGQAAYRVEIAFDIIAEIE